MNKRQADCFSLMTARLNLTAEVQGRIKTDRPLDDARRELREIEAKLAHLMPPMPSEASTPAS